MLYPLSRQDDFYSRLPIQKNICNLYRITLLKRLTHSLTDCVTFCINGCFVKCFQHWSSVIIKFLRSIKCYSTIRRNCKNKILCRYKDKVNFVGCAFSMDTKIYEYNVSSFSYMYIYYLTETKIFDINIHFSK